MNQEIDLQLDWGDEPPAELDDDEVRIVEALGEVGRRVFCAVHGTFTANPAWGQHPDAPPAYAHHWATTVWNVAIVAGLAADVACPDAVPDDDA